MSTLMQSLSDFLNVLIQAFNFSSSFPALVFVLLSRLYVLPLFPENWPIRIDKIGDGATQALVTIILVALIAYFLDAANLSIIRFFEGYWFTNQYPLAEIRRKNQEHVLQTTGQIRDLEVMAALLIDEAKKQTREDLLDMADRVIEAKSELVRQIADKYPEDADYVLPSPFGNVIAAAEQYPSKVLGMDAVVLWPFLVPTLTKNDYARYVARERAVMDFLVNLTVVLFSFGFLLGITEWTFNSWSGELALKLGLVLACCAVTFRLSIQGASGWGATIRTAFVLFREDLREALHLRKPKNYKDERQIWETASDFLRAQSSEENQEQWGMFLFDASSYGKADQVKQEEKS